MAIEIPHMKLSHDKHKSRDLGGNYANLARELGGWSERVDRPVEVANAILRARRQTEDGQTVSAGIRHQRRDGVFEARRMTGDDDLFEAEELQRAAEWRLRKADADPADEVSGAAARQLEKLAADMRLLRGSPLFQEYLAICNWLGESRRHYGLLVADQRLSRADRRGSLGG